MDAVYYHDDYMVGVYLNNDIALGTDNLCLEASVNTVCYDNIPFETEFYSNDYCVTPYFHFPELVFDPAADFCNFVTGKSNTTCEVQGHGNRVLQNSH